MKTRFSGYQADWGMFGLHIYLHVSRSMPLIDFWFKAVNNNASINPNSGLQTALLLTYTASYIAVAPAF